MNITKITSLSEWKDRFLSEHVQAQELTGNDFLSSETVVLVSGPPKLGIDVMPANLVPIGLVQNAQVQQQKQIQQLYEIGSRQPFFIPGRTFITAGIARILFDGPSLMYAMSMRKIDPDGTLFTAGYTTSGDRVSKEHPTLPPPGDGDPAEVFDYYSADTADPGYFFSNLSSAFFNIPLGLGFMLYDGDRQSYGGFYLENCYIQTHTFTIAANQTVLLENVTLRAGNLRPLQAGEIFGVPPIEGHGGETLV